jgi:glutamine kinase
MKFNTKSKTLENLYGNIKNGIVLPQISFNVRDWQDSSYLDIVFNSKISWINNTTPVIVRSSSQHEDSMEQSLAGHFESVLNVIGKENLIEAISKVVNSLDQGSQEDEIFIQPMLNSVDLSGVAFTRDSSNNGYYYVVNYDDSGSGSTSSVTDGSSNNLSTYYHFKSLEFSKIKWIDNLLKLLRELEEKFNMDSLDVEFAFKENKIYLLQVRPLILKQENVNSQLLQKKEISNIEKHISSLSKPHPYLLGDKSIFGVMPDWNPAEIIGIRPKPLALSLYRELITDGVWAYQRDNYGYKNLRSFPLIYNFSGFPYIDIRVSFSSFIPKDLEDDLSYRLVNYYIKYLSDNPSLHDKVEFDVVFSCYTLDLTNKITDLEEYGFSKSDRLKIINSLRRLTNSIIEDANGLWKKDLAKMEELKVRQEKIKKSSLTNIEKIFWLIEDCKRYGTLPFAGLARAGFIAVEILKSLVNVNIMNSKEYQLFLGNVKTVSSNMIDDLSSLSKEKFVEKYGHLRPGTYEITSSRYDEDINSYFGSPTNTNNKKDSDLISLSPGSMEKLNQLLKKHEISHDAKSLLNFIKNAIEAREYSKFVFSKSLSDTLKLIAETGGKIGLAKEDLSFANIKDIMNSYSVTQDLKATLGKSIKKGRASYQVTKNLQLPTLIINPSDVWSFARLKNEPNFVTLLSAKGHVVNVSKTDSNLKDCILMIPSADPGFDWIFSRDISAFITMYGGVNSHMSIRASEIGIPAIIGAGESLYKRWNNANMLEIDCSNKTVLILK